MSGTNSITFTEEFLVEMRRLNDNVEALLVNGIEVRTLPALAVGDERIKTPAQRTRASIFLALAIDSGALQLDEPPPPRDGN